MEPKRVPLYERLPEIYWIRDAEQRPPDQLKHYLALVEEVFGAIHANIDELYHDLFIETGADWVVPYLGDLLGTSHLKGDPWTLRADVADTIALRRRKGTLASIERLTYNLTRWGVHAAELRERLVWNQHINHLRPDAGGAPPYATATRFAPVRGGTVPVRSPAMLSLLDTPFDPFAHVADVRPPMRHRLRHNLPNLAIFLWRLEEMRVRAAQPYVGGADRGVHPTGTTGAGEATHVVRLDVHPQGEPVRLFNTYRFDPDRDPPVVTDLDATPGPIPRARLSEGDPAGRPEAYFAVDTYDPDALDLATLDISEVGLQLHVPEPAFAGDVWTPEGVRAWRVRGANLCAWEDGVQPPLQDRDVVVDPEIGRIVMGVGTIANGQGAAEAAALMEGLLVTHTYGSAGAVGAHPISRASAPDQWNGAGVERRIVDYHDNPNSLREALDDIQDATAPVVIEIRDSMTHDLDIMSVQGRIPEDGGFNLRLAHPLIIRAAGGHRPVIRLARALRFRPLDPAAASGLTLRLEGLYLTRDPDAFPAGEPLIARAALDVLEIDGCTLDPGGYRQLEGLRAPSPISLDLRAPYGFADPADEVAFDQTPRILLRRSVAGPLRIDRGYTLWLTDSIVDAGAGVLDDATGRFALTNATDPANAWGPPTHVDGVTLFGLTRTETIDGQGGLFVHPLDVLNNQRGCLRYSYFSGDGDRLPQHLGCVFGSEAQLRFTDEAFGEPAYGQLALAADVRIREHGPDDDAMGAFGWLLDAHKWRNLQIRYREFMPVGIRPLLIPVT